MQEINLRMASYKTRKPGTKSKAKSPSLKVTPDVVYLWLMEVVVEEAWLSEVKTSRRKSPLIVACYIVNDRAANSHSLGWRLGYSF